MTLFPDTDESLIAKVSDLGDGAAWAEFVGLYQPAILRIAIKRGLQEADALDVLQQVLISVAKSIENWSPIAGGPPFRAWLTTIAGNAINNALSRKPLDKAVGGSSVIDRLASLPAESVSRTPQSELFHEVRYQAILWAADQIRHEFSDEIWHCFWRTAIQGASIQAVATELNRSPGSIYVGRFRIVSRLREKVQELSIAWEL